eukprot:Blabericola_migrator_1__3952@NODE_219_length_11213_cov_124_951821_g186_i0_p7_GENE_NODE_219_length_11213_cov_124_951821_g186_i0NODE_219_length_11213_cov_124_951821_g186_i0_p7_ORF_typecomplete_len350_score43_39CPW_WPC/PF09717_10/2_6CPW_WPC/PF09717_10/1_5e02NIF/PF03031_18/0_19NIF/PF03031_18/3_2e03_NODE_219_length_11213_cov_124_951821_g186_i014082457
MPAPRASEAAPFAALPGEMTSSSEEESSGPSHHNPYASSQGSSSDWGRTFPRSSKRPKGKKYEEPLVHRKSVKPSPAGSLSRNSTEMSETQTPDSPPATELFAPEGTILIFDWDDTLCPSTWLSSHDLTLDEACAVPPEYESLLRKMATCSQKTLEVASRLGSVVIVTNAEQGWIEMSCRKFLPSLYPYLSTFKQLSARTMYESPSANCPFAWKQMAFKKEIYSHFIRTQARKKNVISLGDSAHERLAILAVTRPLSAQDGLPRLLGPLSELPPDPEFVRALGQCRTKSVKLIERPNIEELMQEHDLICKVLEEVVQHDEDLDLCIKGASPTSASSPPNESYIPQSSSM